MLSKNVDGIQNAKMELWLKKKIPNKPEIKNLPYLEAVDSLLYISQISRPDLTYAVNTVSSYCKGPKWRYWQAVKSIMRFLKNIIDLKLTFNKSFDAKIMVIVMRIGRTILAESQLYVAFLCHQERFLTQSELKNCSIIYDWSGVYIFVFHAKKRFRFENLKEN